MTEWIVVANRTDARVYCTHPFALHRNLHNELGREKNKAMTTDKPGWSRSKLSQPSSTHSLTGEKNPHEDAAIDFARRIAHYLLSQSQAHHVDKLTVCAEPKMMGRIRGNMDEHLSEEIEWVPKDLGHATDHEIETIFKDRVSRV